MNSCFRCFGHRDSYISVDSQFGALLCWILPWCSAPYALEFYEISLGLWNFNTFKDYLRPCGLSCCCKAFYVRTQLRIEFSLPWFVNIPVLYYIFNANAIYSVCAIFLLSCGIYTICRAIDSHGIAIVNCSVFIYQRIFHAIAWIVIRSYRLWFRYMP